ncbi:MAG: SulP family inorganic anion transporter [Lachnospiraceae bacterium]|nr:SulP family inorganic anion transporter [Lachnospiraceae bacterium]
MTRRKSSIGTTGTEGRHRLTEATSKDRYMKENYRFKNVITDIFAGIIVALVSIPISMGYANVAGLPMKYGLYGSVFPILVFALFTTTKNFVFGVDAAPAAIVGSSLAVLGIESESAVARNVVPVITLLVGIWLLLFFVFKLGKVVRYISMPVMGGFVTGICCTIILMQIPKLYGAAPVSGEGLELIKHIVDTAGYANLLSLFLGLATVIIILVTRKFVPKLPTAVIMMVVGACLTRYANLDKYDVRLLPHVKGGLPEFVTLSLRDLDITEILTTSLTIALVIMAETLLASKNTAMKDGKKIDVNREVLAYSLANFASCAVGCLPVNGSVSRTGLSRQYGAKSQLMSVTAAVTMVVIVMKFTWIIEYLPVCMLTAIIIAALLSACEFIFAANLFSTARYEFYIFMAAMFGVLIFGTIYGVLIGVVLSFTSVIIKATEPPRSFNGVMPGRDGLFSLEHCKDAMPIKNVIVYRFGGNLFFANIDIFEEDIMNAIKDDTKIVVVNGSGISDVDVTAVERLEVIKNTLSAKGIKFFLTEQMHELDDKLKAYGASDFIEEGNVTMSVQEALAKCGLHAPYEPDIEL